MPGSLLIMTYEFPPAGGGGVQRVTKFARYLPDFGWRPVVLTSEPTRGRPTDESLLTEVSHVPAVRLPARNVSSLIARSLSPVKKARESLRRGQSPAGSEGATPPVEKAAPPVSARLARSLAMDDAVWWARAAQRRGVSLGREHGVSAVLASGPPFSVLVAGRHVAAALDVPLVADMRDGWRDNPAAWYPSPAARRRALRAELAVLAAADVVLAVSPRIAVEAMELGGRDVRVLPNGFDPDDVVPRRPQQGGPLRLVFMGKMYGRLTEPWDVFKALARVRSSHPGLAVTLEIIGEAGGQIRSAAESAGLSATVDFSGYLPHAEAIGRVARADVAVVIVADRPGAKAVLTGKLFEYLAIGMPILALVPPDGDAAQLMTSLDAGWVIRPHDVTAVADAIVRLALEKRDGTLHGGAPPEAIAKYERRALTGELAAVLSGVTAPPAGRSEA